MGTLRNDGDYEIFVIEHKYADESENDEWHGSGDCGGFFPKGPFNKREWLKTRRPFEPLYASGRCWQETGVHGTYDLEKAMKALVAVSNNNPGRKFRVSKVIISQRTVEVSRMTVEKGPKND